MAAHNLNLSSALHTFSPSICIQAKQYTGGLLRDSSGDEIALHSP